MSKRWIFFVVIIIVGVGLAYGGKLYQQALEGREQGADEGNLTGQEMLFQQAEEIVGGMSDEELVGQLLIAGFSGTEPDYYIKRMIELRHFGGVILFGRNVESAEQVQAMTAALQQLAQAGGTLPLWICVDEEGGIVRRLQGIVDAETNPPELASLNDPKYTENMAEAVGHQLRELGINVNFAPVVDIGFPQGIMVERSFGADADQVAELGAALVRGYHAGGVMATAKHFPGLGRAVTDPHGEPVVIAADRATLAEDLRPFQAMIAEDVDIVMVSHALYPAYDETAIASMSVKIQEELLRQQLGFAGIIVADDIEMGAALAKGSVGAVAVAMVLAGADQLLLCHTPEKQAEAYDAIVAAVADGTITRSRLEASAVRIVMAKLSMGMLN
jgi:beta-N-acetylhexosaminidase